MSWRSCAVGWILLCQGLALPPGGAAFAQGSAPEPRPIDDRGLRSLPAERLPATRSIVVSDDSVEFGRVAAGCFGDDGVAVVLSTAPRTLLVLDPRGKGSVRTVGTGGNGPGELSRPWALSCLGADSAAVLELFRLTLVSLPESRLHSRTIEPLVQGRLLQPVARFANGRMLFRAHDAGPGQRLGTQRDTVELLLSPGAIDRRAGGNLIARLPGDEYVRVQGGSGQTMAVHPFGRSLLIAANATTALVLDTGADRLTAYSMLGEPTRAARFSTQSRRLDPAAAEAQRARRERAARSKAERDLASLLARHTAIPEFLPRYDRMIARRDGGVLLREFTLEGDSLTNWLVLDQALRPQRRLVIETNARVLAADGDRLLLLEAGDDGARITMAPLARLR